MLTGDLYIIMENKIKWIFFDMGHTLLDEDDTHLSRIKLSTQELNNRGINITEEEFYKVCCEMAEQNLNAYPAAAKKLGAQKILLYDRNAEKPFPETIPTLKELKLRGYKLGIIANQPGGAVKRLHKHGIMEYIDFVSSSDELGLEKPNFNIFEFTLNTLGTPPHEAVMVGDRVDNDVKPAKKLGMTAVKINKGFHRFMKQDEETYKADYVIDTLDEMLNYFK